MLRVSHPQICLAPWMHDQYQAHLPSPHTPLPPVARHTPSSPFSVNTLPLSSVRTHPTLLSLRRFHQITPTLFWLSAQGRGGLHTWTLRWTQMSGLSFVGRGRCIRMFLLCSLVVPRGPSMYTGQEYTARPAWGGRSLVPRAWVLTLTGGRGLGRLEGLSCKAPASGSHSAFQSCSPISSSPISGTVGFGPFTTWGRQKLVRQG